MYSAAPSVNTLRTALLGASQLTLTCRFLSASRCAVFTCRLSHVILQERTLILLHCPSTVNSCTKSTSFHSILTAPQRDSGPLWFRLERWCSRIGREKLGRGTQERSLSQLSLSSARWCALIYDTLSLNLSLSLSISLARPTLPPSLHPTLPSLSLSLLYKLSLALVCSHMTCAAQCDTTFNYYSKQTCEPINWWIQIDHHLHLLFTLILFSSILPSLYTPFSSYTSHLFLNLPPSFCSSFFYTSTSFLIPFIPIFLSIIIIPLQLAFCCSEIPPPLSIPLSLSLSPPHPIFLSPRFPQKGNHCTRAWSGTSCSQSTFVSDSTNVLWGMMMHDTRARDM